MTLRTLTVRGIPEGVLKALRGAAKRNRRSLNAEVLVLLDAAAGAAEAEGRPRARRGAGREGDREAGVGRGATARVAEQGVQPYEVRRAFEEADLSRLRSDLALTPAQRVHLAEGLARVEASARPRPRLQRVIQFDRYEDYLDWRRSGDRGR